jgi:tetratricopeptide (TPR) repeat protein
MPGNKKKRSPEPIDIVASNTAAPKRHDAFFLALVLLALVVAYLPALRGGPLWDDAAHITKPQLQSSEGLYRIWFKLGATQQYYPLLHSAFWLEHKLWGDSVLGYHCVTLLWHAVAVLLAYFVLTKLAVPGALLAAAVFALHPVMVESVAWITEQKNTLSAVFYLSAMLVYLDFDRSRSPQHYFIALALFVFGLLTKTVTATLPAALLVIFWWQRGTLAWKRDILLLLPFFLLGAFAGLATAWVERTLIGAQGAEFELTILQRALLAGRVIWFYVGKLIWPTNLTFIYPRWQVEPAVWWQWLFPAAAVGVTVAFWLLRRKFRGPLAAWLLFVGTLFPVLGFLNVYPFIFSFVADHFQYLASLALIALVAAGITRGLAMLPKSEKLIGNSLVVLSIGALVFLSRQQSRMYADSFALYQATLDRNPDCWMAHCNLGVGLTDAGKPQDAIEHFRAALRIRPNYPEAYNGLGFALMKLGKNSEAIEQFEQAAHLWPDNVDVFNNFGLALTNLGRPQQAIIKLQSALAKRPEDPLILNNMGVALSHAGRTSEAIEKLEHAIRLSPGFAEAHNSLGIALARSGETRRAIAHFSRAVQLNPSDANTHKNLATMLADTGDAAGAIAHLQEAIRLQPDLVSVHFRLAELLRKTGKKQEAAEHYQAALRMQPTNVGAQSQLAQLLAELNRPDEAIKAAEKCIEIARSADQPAVAAQMAEWLKNYRAKSQPGADPAAPQHK